MGCLIMCQSFLQKLHCVRVQQVKTEAHTVREEADGEVRVLYPHEARLRGLHYTRILYATFRHQIFQVDFTGRRTLLHSGTKEEKIGEIPVMVRSKYCSLYGASEEDLVLAKEDPADCGGYFIIYGKEKVCITYSLKIGACIPMYWCIRVKRGFFCWIFRF
jgi:DNA-directed RNA polymerase beta subunit